MTPTELQSDVRTPRDYREDGTQSLLDRSPSRLGFGLPRFFMGPEKSRHLVISEKRIGSNYLKDSVRCLFRY